jgi:hypothetical protein
VAASIVRKIIDVLLSIFDGVNLRSVWPAEKLSLAIVAIDRIDTWSIKEREKPPLMERLSLFETGWAVATLPADLI